MQRELLGSAYAHAAGTAISSTAAVTTPAGSQVTGVTCLAVTAAGSVVITPKNGSAQQTIPIPIGTSWDAPDEVFMMLRPGSTLAFTDCDAYTVHYGILGQGLG